MAAVAEDPAPIRSRPVEAADHGGDVGQVEEAAERPGDGGRCVSDFWLFDQRHTARTAGQGAECGHPRRGDGDLGQHPGQVAGDSTQRPDLPTLRVPLLATDQGACVVEKVGEGRVFGRHFVGFVAIADPSTRQSLLVEPLREQPGCMVEEQGSGPIPALVLGTIGGGVGGQRAHFRFDLLPGLGEQPGPRGRPVAAGHLDRQGERIAKSSQGGARIDERERGPTAQPAAAGLELE